MHFSNQLELICSSPSLHETFVVKMILQLQTISGKRSFAAFALTQTKGATTGVKFQEGF